MIELPDELGARVATEIAAAPHYKIRPHVAGAAIRIYDVTEFTWRPSPEHDGVIYCHAGDLTIGGDINAWTSLGRSIFRAVTEHTVNCPGQETMDLGGDAA